MGLSGPAGRYKEIWSRGRCLNRELALIGIGNIYVLPSLWSLSAPIETSPIASAKVYGRS